MTFILLEFLNYFHEPKTTERENKKTTTTTTANNNTRLFLLIGLNWCVTCKYIPHSQQEWNKKLICSRHQQICIFVHSVFFFLSLVCVCFVLNRLNLSAVILSWHPMVMHIHEKKVIQRAHNWWNTVNKVNSIEFWFIEKSTFIENNVPFEVHTVHNAFNM